HRGEDLRRGEARLDEEGDLAGVDAGGARVAEVGAVEDSCAGSFQRSEVRDGCVGAAERAEGGDDRAAAPGGGGGEGGRGRVREHVDPGDGGSGGFVVAE